MFITHLNINNFRNITSAELQFKNKINIFTGNNGAGKTTTLEAIYYLGRAKSFRASNRNSPVQKGKTQFTLFAEAIDANSKATKIGISKQGKETLAKVNGVAVKKLSTLASTLPIILITPQSHRLLEEGPDNRRRILNWGVFHVEHTYNKVISDFNRILQQRNNALRAGSKDLSVWNNAFSDHGERVSQFHESYFEEWKAILLKMSREIQFLEGLDVRLKKGWREGLALIESIKEKEISDKERGFTSTGPHRADLLFRIDGVETSQILSRGQQKVLIIISMMAQSNVLEMRQGKKALLLMDDLDSELDESSQATVQKLIQAQNCQTFITSLNSNRLTSGDFSDQVSVFHVEHGRFL